MTKHYNYCHKFTFTERTSCDKVRLLGRKDFVMEAIAVTLVLVGAMGLFMSNIGSDIPIKQDQSIMILLAVILF